MILKVHYWPDTCLREVAEDIDPTHPDVRKLVDDLFETMYASNGMGLAATQCAVAKRVLVLDGTLAVITEEGCLSFPGVYARVERLEGVIVETSTLTGEREDVILSGVDAVCFQHELDHLNGIVFYDYLGPAKKRLMDEKVRKNVKKINRRKK